MIDLYIEHNPFTIETKILVDQEQPESNSELSNFTNQRLQFWIDELFGKLYSICGDEFVYNVTFKGVDTDCLDVEEAVANANDKGFKITLTCERTEGGESKLTKITQLIEEARENPLFKDYFDQSRDIQENLRSALNKDFDAYVVATMSSGKSTFINGMMGSDLLPALNEATTATIAKIYNDKTKAQGEFIVGRTSKQGALLSKDHGINIKNDKADAEILSEWNKDPNTYSINIEGNILGIDANDNVRLVITDTPGPNNSQDADHGITTMTYIKDSERSPMILYILNATQLGINDDRGLLQEISQIMHQGGKQSKDRFIFILNKADVFDPEKGENVGLVVERAKKYLMDNGIESPRIYPVSAHFTSLLRKRDLNPNLLTRSERGDLNKFEDLFLEEDSMNLVNYMPLNNSEKKILNDKGYSMALVRSGTPAVEVVISEYINKYNLPHRVSRAYEVLKEVILKSSNKAELEKDLEMSESDLVKLQEMIDVLKDQEDLSATTQGFINSLKSDKALPDEVSKYIKKRSLEVLSEIQAFGDVLPTGYVDINAAEHSFDKLGNSIKLKIESFIVDLSKVQEKAQYDGQRELLEYYQKYMSNVFGNVADITGMKLPVFDGLCNQLSGIAEQAFVLRDDDIKDVDGYVTKTRTVSASRWFNPFSWGKTKKEEYDVLVTEKKVDMLEAWSNRFIEISNYFNDTRMQATMVCEEQARITLKTFKCYITREFDKCFSELIHSLEEQIQNKTQREREIAQAKQHLQAIEVFEEKLTKILSL